MLTTSSIATVFNPSQRKHYLEGSTFSVFRLRSDLMSSFREAMVIKDDDDDHDDSEDIQLIGFSKFEIYFRISSSVRSPLAIKLFTLRTLRLSD